MRRPVQGHHRLAGAGSAVHDEGALEVRADDGVLNGLKRGERIAHSAGPRLGQPRDECREDVRADV